MWPGGVVLSSRYGTWELYDPLMISTVRFSRCVFLYIRTCRVAAASQEAGTIWSPRDRPCALIERGCTKRDFLTAYKIPSSFSFSATCLSSCGMFLTVAAMQAQFALKRLPLSWSAYWTTPNVHPSWVKAREYMRPITLINTCLWRYSSRTSGNAVST